MKNKKQFYTICILLFTSFFIAVGCKKNIKTNDIEEKTTPTEVNKEETLYRPNFHFSPKANWMNDPNGMFYLNGKYHLYFQYYPDGNVWGPMHWGHAVSEDMVTWEEQPIALYPDDLGLIFSGSAVVDKNNTSGFGKDGIAPVVAIFTYHNMQGEKEGKIDFQTQAIAYSLDEGMTWTKYDKNPVISNPGIKDFRDPKVIWDDKSSKWIMALAAGNKIMFYSSINLKNWNFESEFGEFLGAHGGVWECPDLFPLKIDGSDTSKWVLIVSINPGGPNGGSATQYFVGDFDGNKFVLDEDFSNQLQKQNAAWLDYGKDNYAGVTWSNIPKSDERKLFIGWMSNWDYAREVPTFKWRSTMTIPRELKLRKTEKEYYLQNLPVSELYKHASKSIKKDSLNVDGLNDIFRNENIDLSKLNLELKLNNLKEKIYTINFLNKSGDTLSLGLNNVDKAFFLDRRKSGKVDFSEKFAPKVSEVKTDAIHKELKVQILLDKTSIEVFYNDGEVVMTELFFPNEPMETFSITIHDDYVYLTNIKVQEFK